MGTRNNETDKRNEDSNHLWYEWLYWDLNFVLGGAYRGVRVAAIYIPRLRQEFYHLNPDEVIFRDRIVKEAIHELGHSFGLYHWANKKCVMYFSNSLKDTDFKQRSFCPNCKNNL